MATDQKKTDKRETLIKNHEEHPVTNKNAPKTGAILQLTLPTQER